jgi:hypothetical protein
MSILSFKLDFYMFVLSRYHIYIYTYISLQTIFYLVSIVVPYCTFCRVIYKYIYARLPLLKKKQTNTDSFVVVDVVISLFFRPTCYYLLLLLFSVVRFFTYICM